VYKIEAAVAKLRGFKSRGSRKSPAELIEQKLQQYVPRSLHIFLVFGMRRNCVSSGKSLLYTKWVMKLAVIIIDKICFQSMIL
jgi:hypothetical protein